MTEKAKKEEEEGKTQKSDGDRGYKIWIYNENHYKTVVDKLINKFGYKWECDNIVEYSLGIRLYLNRDKKIQFSNLADGYSYFQCRSEREVGIEYLEGIHEAELRLSETTPTKADIRKGTPVTSGVLLYFPDAIREVAKASKAGNDQHHPDKPLHWDKSKSTDEYDAMVRHLLDHHENPIDDDGVLHLAKVAWRALAGLQRYMDSKGLCNDL